LNPLTNPKVLVLHNLRSNTRQTTIDFAAAFGRHVEGVEVHYMNLFGIAAAGELEDSYDLGIVTAEALSVREAPFWPEMKQRIVRHMRRVKRKVIFPQDDYTFSTRLDELVIEAGIDAVWSPLERDEALYPKSVRQGVSFRKCLTGYVEDYWLSRYAAKSKPFEDRTIDLGQRVGASPLSFGDSGRRKFKITQELANEFEIRGMTVDVSFDSNDVLLGDDWLSFLGNTRFTVSRKGGASLADTKLCMRMSLERLHNLFGQLSESALYQLASKRGVKRGVWEEVSPRLFEAAAMGVCQILEQGDYLGGALEPWVHYIPLDSNFENLEEIFSFVARGDLVQAMVENARELLVKSGDFSYKSFMESFYRQEMGDLQVQSCGFMSPVDLDESSTMVSKIEMERVRDYFEKVNSLNFAQSYQEKKEIEALYARLMDHEIFPESFITNWVGIDFHLALGD